MLSNAPEILLQQAQTAFEQNNYAHAALLYEQLVEQEPEQLKHVWNLGLARLLAGQEEEAQLTWMMAISEIEPDELDRCSLALVDVLETEAKRQEAAEAWHPAWIIRQHLGEIAPLEINNLLRSLQLAVKLNLFDLDYLEKLQVIELLQSETFPDLDEALLIHTLLEVFCYGSVVPTIKTFVEAGLTHVQDHEALAKAFYEKGLDLRSGTNSVREYEQALYLLEICVRFQPDNAELWEGLSFYYDEFGRHSDALEAAKRVLQLAQTPLEQMTAIGVVSLRLLRVGKWQEVLENFEQEKELLTTFLRDYTPDSDSLSLNVLTLPFFYSHYVKDAPAELRPLQNQIAAIIQTGWQPKADLSLKQHQQRAAAIKTSSSNKAAHKLKVGYISHHMNQHAVGSIARWLMRHHDHDRFDICTYHTYRATHTDFSRYWFVDSVKRSARFDKGTPDWIATYLCETEQVDILVDLDSLTFAEACAIMACKPAPIQISWLGFDAPGMPTIDYFIADPYVLPEQAQDYYTEKIWRLPSTYLAVDGFEIGVPTLRRDQLGIPADAIIYFSVQDGKKRHPETTRLQIQILREVPNSYLLIKGYGDQESMKQMFKQLAEEEGVAFDRLRFLERDLTEAIHRANLGIADVVLDTFPYNGATTTLETLWMGVPLVTRVGQQWAARNSYTMMMNVGVREGIAQTSKEYLEWGIRLGTDAALRQDISWRLKRSRQISPLWNTKQFAREMENAYEQMWKIYLDTH